MPAICRSRVCRPKANPENLVFLKLFLKYYNGFIVLVFANVAELVDALDLGSSGATRGSSSLPFRTKMSAVWRGVLGLCAMNRYDFINALK